MSDSFIVIDFETTGTSPSQGDRAVEIACVRVQDNTIIDSFDSLIKTGVRSHPGALKVHGLGLSELDKAPTANVVMDRFMDYVADDEVFVAHNAPFDSRFLDNELELAGIEFEHHFLCTLKLARMIYPDFPNHKLGTVADHLGVKRTGKAHRALSDTKVTAEVFIKISQTLQERLQLTDILDFDFLAEFERNRLKRSKTRYIIGNG